MSQGLPGYISTQNGLPKTGFQGPVLVGKVMDGGTSGPIPPAGGLMAVQSTASLTNQVVTTSATGLQHASLLYLPVTTGPLVGAAAPPFTGVGTPLVWNDGNKTLQIWSSGAASWMTLVATTSMALGGFTTSAV